MTRWWSSKLRLHLRLSKYFNYLYMPTIIMTCCDVSFLLWHSRCREKYILVLLPRAQSPSEGVSDHLSLAVLAIASQEDGNLLLCAKKLLMCLALRLMIHLEFIVGCCRCWHAELPRRLFYRRCCANQRITEIVWWHRTKTEKNKEKPTKLYQQPLLP